MLAASLVAPSFAGQTTPSMSCDELSKNTQALTVIDARYPADYQHGHIKGAVSLPFYDLKKISYPKNQAIVVYCSGIGCSLSHDAAITLQELGYANVKVLTGGFAEWSMKGFPVVGAPNAPSTIKTPYHFPAWATFQTTEVSPKDLWSNIQSGGKFYLIDARPPKEYAAGHLPGAHNIAVEDLAGKTSTLAKTVEYVVYDRKPERSRAMAMKLQDAGLPAHLLSGGVSVWTAQGLPMSVAPDDAK